MAKDLKKIASACLAYNKHFDKVYVTSDGVPFQHKNDAVNYALKLSEKDVQVFERGEAGAETTLEKAVSTAINANKEYDLNTKDTVALIVKAESIDAVMLLIAGDDRKTVKAAAEKQIAILKQKALDDQAAAADEANAKRNAEIPKDPEGTEDVITGAGSPGTDDETKEAEGIA